MHVCIAESALQGVGDLDALFDFLQDDHDGLGWRIPPYADLGEITFDWSEGGRSQAPLWQIRPLTPGQPWGIFVVQMESAKLSVTQLREALRQLVPRRFGEGDKPTWAHQDLLFIVTHGSGRDFGVSFAWFRGETAAKARISSFGWRADDTAATRTLRDLNLPALRWPDNPADHDAWRSQWSSAFDVEKVTNAFFKRYCQVFDAVEGMVQGVPDERKRLFTQRLFNRLLFIQFLQKKNWLRFQGSTNYLPTLWKAHQQSTAPGKNFYRDRLQPLFFEALNTPQGVDVIGINRGGFLADLVGEAPFLNGGLFSPAEDDRSGEAIPDEAFDPIINDLFAHYNFTITESTPQDVEVAVDPEMLGRVFEELVTGRHETGSYYTPRPIVSFMCREALKGYLADACPNENAHAIARFVDEHEAEHIANPEAVLDALKRVKVCDPACGSGAYLLGMMQELLLLRKRLFISRQVDPASDYKRKLEIIQNNLYGVDKDPFAANVAMLRLWLALVVDDTRNPLEQKGVNVALPNLDFKIACGDSLTAPDPSGSLQPDLLREERINEFERLKGEYMRSSDGGTKQSLSQQITAVRQEIADYAYPGEQTEGFDWRVEMAEVLNGGGFDIVVANPPYVRQELLGNDYKETRLRPVYPGVYAGTADLYVYFYARALQLLRPEGMMAFISSNKWFRAAYGKKLRARLAERTAVRSITDFGDLPVFQGATAYPMVFIARKDGDRPGDAPVWYTPVKSLDPPYPDMRALVEAQGSALPASALSGENWTLADAATTDRLARMRANGIPLGEYVKGQIYRGVLTGFNEAFVIDGQKRAELIAEDPESAKIIKPLVTGRDVKRWVARSNDKWLIVTKIGVDMSRYPAIFRHLKKYQTQLEKRWDKGEHWWELRACAYYDAFDKPKIIFPDIAVSCRFAFDTSEAFASNTAYVVPTANLFLLGVLNSRVVEEYYVEISAQVRGGYLRFIRQYVEQIPIPNATDTQQQEITRLAQRCLDAGGVECEAWEAEISERVEALYGL